MYSCRVIQKALEVCTLEEKVDMVAELEGHLLRCVRDQNGNHVVQKIIECVPTEHITTLLSTVLAQLVPLAVHSFGCRVVQRILEHCTDQIIYDKVMKEIQEVGDKGNKDVLHRCLGSQESGWLVAYQVRFSGDAPFVVPHPHQLLPGI